jgi:hypothetical protein
MRTLYLFAAASLLMVFVGCSSSDSGNSTPVLGDICTSSADCGGQMVCHSDTTNYVANGQCTASTECSKDSQCSGFGSAHGAMCIGANICVATCGVQSDCPNGTICNSYGWCERTGPGSGNMYCSGTPQPCTGLGSYSCSARTDCFDDGFCSGVSSNSSMACSTWSTQSFCTSYGCTWNANCTGGETSCESITVSHCSTVPGCHATQG